MKKTFFYFLVALVVIIGAYLLLGEFQERKLVKEAQGKAESFIYRNYEGITEVKVNKENYQFDPLGGLSVGGHVNGDTELYFTLLYNTSSEGIEKVTSVVSPKNFPTEKEECKDNFCQ